MFSFYKSVLLAAMAGQASAATSTATQSPYPIPYNWSKFPAGMVNHLFYNFFSFFQLVSCAFFSTSGRFVHDGTYYMPVSLAVVTPSMGWHFCEDAVCKQQHPPSLN